MTVKNYCERLDFLVQKSFRQLPQLMLHSAKDHYDWASVYPDLSSGSTPVIPCQAGCRAKKPSD